MAQHNVREGAYGSISSILFGSDGETLTEEDGICLKLQDDEWEFCFFRDDVPYLIKALQKAQELGWAPTDAPGDE